MILLEELISNEKKNHEDQTKIIKGWHSDLRFQNFFYNFKFRIRAWRRLCSKFVP